MSDQQTNDAIKRKPVDQEIISLATYLGNRGKLVDIHELTVAVRLRIPYAEVSRGQRMISKHWGLGALYGSQGFDWKTEPAETPELLTLVAHLGELPEGSHAPMPPLPSSDGGKLDQDAHARWFTQFMGTANGR